MTVDRQKLVKIIRRVNRDNPDFGAGLMKWVPFLCSSINKISWMTGQSDEDILQDILVGVSEINLIYSIPLYRYKGRLYEKVKEHGSLMLLRTPRNNKTAMSQIWVESEAALPVKKGKLESVIYREIFQQSVDILNSYFTQKNGFKKHEKGKKMVVVHSGKAGLELRNKKIQGVRKTVEIVDNFGSENEVSWLSNPENNVIFGQYVDKIKENISDTAASVLDVLISDPGAPVRTIADYLDLDVDTVNLSRCEIIQNLPFDSDKVARVDDLEGYFPVYMSAG